MSDLDAIRQCKIALLDLLVEIERNREAIDELVGALKGVDKYVNHITAITDPGFYQMAVDCARAAIAKYDNTTKETK